MFEFTGIIILINRVLLLQLPLAWSFIGILSSVSQKKKKNKNKSKETFRWLELSSLVSIKVITLWNGFENDILWHTDFTLLTLFTASKKLFWKKKLMREICVSYPSRHLMEISRRNFFRTKPLRDQSVSAPQISQISKIYNNWWM